MARVNKTAGIQAARIAGDSAVMDHVASTIASKAKSLAAGHGGLSADIGTTKTPGPDGVTDRLVYLDNEAAAAIEFGHLTRHGESSTEPAHWVQGLYVMTNAMSAV